jgi:hypothetical protein
MRFAPPALAAAALLFLNGCATPEYTDIGATQTIGLPDGISVSPQIEWGQANMAGFRGTLWTVDGTGLDALLFFVAQTGRPLIERPSGETDRHVYQASMLPEDVMELTAANFEKVGYLQVKTSNLRPAAFGSAKGFRFEMTFTNKAGLQMNGMALACQRDGKLDMIVFVAPAEYYFGHYAPVVEKIFNSVQVAA